MPLAGKFFFVILLLRAWQFSQWMQQDSGSQTLLSARLMSFQTVEHQNEFKV
jgi:hypothetical protein